MVRTHTDIQLLINSFDANEKENLQKWASLFIAPEHANFLFNYSTATAFEMAEELKLSDKQYKAVCKTTYEQLCRFLLFNKNIVTNNIEHELTETQLLAEMLKEKGLFAEAQKRLQTAIEAAKENELFSREIFLLHQYLQIISYVQAYTEEAKLLPILQRIEFLSNQQTEQERLHIIYYQLITLRYKMAFRTSDDEQKEIKQVQNKLQRYQPELLQSNTNRIYYYQSALLTGFMLGCTEKILLWNASLLHCWQQQSNIIQLHPELFIRSASIQSYTHFLLKDIASAKAHLEHYREMANQHLPSPFYEHWFTIVDFQITIKVLHKTYEYDQLASFFSTKWPSIYSFLFVLRDAERLDIILSACISSFVLQQWQQAETIIQEAKAINQKVKRIDTLYFTFVFHCMILYEQKEWNRLDSLINTEYHFLYSHKTLRLFEKDMLLFFKKLPVTMFKGKAKESMKAFLNKLDTYRENNMQKLHFAIFDFYSWIESKIEGVSYTNYMKEKAIEQQMK